MRRIFSVAAVVLAACASSTASSNKNAAPDARARAQSLVDAPDRTDRDRALDAGRKPADTLAFVQVSPGMRVADLGAGGGYTTELLARAVAPDGVVYAQNPDVFVKSFLKDVWPARLSRPAMKNVVRVDRDFDDPLPPEAKDLDRVVMYAIYHDVTYMQVDRDKMNRAIFAALKPGGEFIVIDSSARPGTGVSDAKTLHRIDEQFVKDEVQKAGFQVQSQGDFLRNPQDARDWDSSPMAAAERRGTSDRFALRFVKP
jgi:predicted methyltransferase